MKSAFQELTVRKIETETLHALFSSKVYTLISMPETKLKPLHLGKSVADLKSHFSNVTGIIKEAFLNM